jgi:hypothetical protein
VCVCVSVCVCVCVCVCVSVYTHERKNSTNTDTSHLLHKVVKLIELVLLRRALARMVHVAYGV